MAAPGSPADCACFPQTGGSAVWGKLNAICMCNLKFMAPHSSTLAWKIPWTEEPGRLQSVGSLRVGHD